MAATINPYQELNRLQLANKLARFCRLNNFPASDAAQFDSDAWKKIAGIKILAANEPKPPTVRLVISELREDERLAAIFASSMHRNQSCVNGKHSTKQHANVTRMEQA